MHIALGYFFDALPEVTWEALILATLVMTLWTVFLPPGILQVALAAWAGFGWGALVAWLGAGAATMLGWLAGTTWLAGPLGRWLASRPRLAPLRPALLATGWRGMVLLRLSAVVPAPLVGPLLGAVGLSAWTVCWASALGKIPGVLLAAAAGSVAALEHETVEAETATPWWAWLGIAVAVLATGLGARLLVRHWQPLLPPDETRD